MIKDKVFLDFEYNQTKSPDLHLVSCACMLNGERETFWLCDNPAEQIRLAEYIIAHSTKVFVAYNVIAEARAMLSLILPFKVTDLKWYDLFLEYRQLSNHNHKIQYGKHLTDGKVKMTFPPKPKWQRTDKDQSFKQKFSLAECCYKLLGKVIDTEHKNKIRDLIISNPEIFTDEEKESILLYNDSDIDYLPALLVSIVEQYKSLLPQQNLKSLKADFLARGSFSARTAIMEKLGYPIDYEATKSFSDSVPSILRDLQREINGLFPDIEPFRFNKKEQRFSWRQTETIQWLRENLTESQLALWLKTPTKNLSLALKAWKRLFDFRHDYPKDNFGAQMVRYLHTKQNLNGFSTNSENKKKTIWDYFGPDQRVRPYFNIYGSQSSRSQPSATSFLFLKSAWMRAMCQPKTGRAIAGVDYGSEEFFISALVARDANMIKAYQSGDVYLYFGKLAGAIPWDGTKKEFKEERDKFKSTTLGISYLMTAIGLSNKLTLDTGKVYTEDDAQDLIDLFYEAYPRLAEWQEEILEQYEDEEFLRLPCGWYMFGDNENFRSVSNMPIQGFGASIMRKAVELAQDRGLDVIFTLHDALYIEFDLGDGGAIDTLMDCMREAFVFYFDYDLKKVAGDIRLDPNVWGPEMPEGKIFTPAGVEVKSQKIYIDERGAREYNNFKQYFENDSDLL